MAFVGFAVYGDEDVEPATSGPHLTDLWSHRDQDLRPRTPFRVPCLGTLGQALVCTELGCTSEFHGTSGPPSSLLLPLFRWGLRL